MSLLPPWFESVLHPPETFAARHETSLDKLKMWKWQATTYEGFKDLKG